MTSRSRAGGRHRAQRRRGMGNGGGGRGGACSRTHPAASTFPWKCRGPGAEAPTTSSRPCYDRPRHVTPTSRRTRTRHTGTRASPSSGGPPLTSHSVRTATASGPGGMHHFSRNYHGPHTIARSTSSDRHKKSIWFPRRTPTGRRTDG